MKNMLKDSGIAHLCKAFRVSRSVVHLNVASNCLSPKGMSILFDSLQHSLSITSIAVGNLTSTNRNVIGALGIKSLGNLLVNT